MPTPDTGNHALETNSQAVAALCNPGSVALVGVSAKKDSPGNLMLKSCRQDGFSGSVFLVNPGYEEIDGEVCYANLSALPSRPDLALIALGNERLDAAFDDVIAQGIKAVVIFASGYLDSDTKDDSLHSRLEARAKAAGIALCGPNAMGLMNPLIGFRALTFGSQFPLNTGGIAFLAQSGSALSALTINQPRLGFAFAVSTGIENVTTIADYMLWCLDQPTIRVIGMFIEGIGDPVSFIQALQTAQSKSIPVVALKVGRTARSAAMAQTHTGALAGNDGAYQALFRRYGVIQVDDMDEFAATLSLLDIPARIGQGGLATMHDSGGEREMFVDLAQATETRLTEISASTKTRLQTHLETGLIADNPLDAYSSVGGSEDRFTELAKALLDDEDTALLGFLANPRDRSEYHRGIVRSAIAAAKYSDKPVFLGSNTYFTQDTEHCAAAREAGIPIIKGTKNILRAANHVMGYRDRSHSTQSNIPVVDVELPSTSCKEAAALTILNAAGIATPQIDKASSEQAILQIADKISYPVVLKTDEGHAHKTEVGGVILNLASAQALFDAYQTMAIKLGPKVLVMEMMPQGVEIGLGAFVDPAFGPVIAVSAGGTMIEVFKDVRFALAPFGTDVAEALVSELKIAPLLESQRGKPVLAKQALFDAISHFSALIWAQRERVSEVDINPIIVTEDNAVAVDALFIAPQNKMRETNG